MSRLIHRLTVMCAVFQLSIGLAIAQEPLTTLIPWRQFEGYPRRQQIGDQGHRILDSWFTGRWYCAVIGAGSKGKPANVPFAAPGLPITDESAIAIVAIDTKSDQARCTLLRPAVLKHLRIQSKDCFSIVAEDAKVERLRRECHDIDFSLPEMVAVHRKIPCDFEPRDGIVRARQDRPIAANGTEKMNWLTSEGNGFATIDVTEANPRTHLLSHGSVQDRIIVSQAIGKSLFSVSEHARGGPAQLLSEFVATFGLIAVSRGCAQVQPRLGPFAVAAYIVGAYWFTASTSFASNTSSTSSPPSAQRWSAR